VSGINISIKLFILCDEYGSYVDDVALLCLQKLTLTSLTSGGDSVGIVRPLTQVTEYSFYSV
jgi:hypothetical protein